MDKFNHYTFESVQFQVESTEAPKIKSGGSSSSNILNRYLEALSQDLVLLAARTGVLADRSNRVTSAANAQAAALLAAFQSVSTRVDQASSYSQVVADAHKSMYINTASSTADISNIFGQVTLPVRSTTNLLVQPDVYGNPYLLSDVEVSYAFNNSTPSDLEYTVDVEALEMLKENQTWVLPPTGTSVWIKIKAPLQFRGLTPNVVEIHPFPAFGINIDEVSYLKAGDSFTGSWTTLDLSYLPNYNSTSTKVEMAGPVRLHLPNDPVSQIRMKLSPRSGAFAMGLHRLRIYHREYDQTGTIVFKDPFSRTIGNTTLKGKDPATLSLLSKSTSGSQLTVTLTTTNTTETPVITYALMAV